MSGHEVLLLNLDALWRENQSSQNGLGKCQIDGYNYEPTLPTSNRIPV